MFSLLSVRRYSCSQNNAMDKPDWVLDELHFFKEKKDQSIQFYRTYVCFKIQKSKSKNISFARARAISI